MDKMSKTGNEVDSYVEVNLSEIHPKKNQFDSYQE